MLTERPQSSGGASATMTKLSEAQSPLRRVLARSASGILPFSVIVGQFALIILVLWQWQLESFALMRVLQLALVGFVIHHLLPLRFRLPFFALLSIVVTMVVLGGIGPQTVVRGLNGTMPLDVISYQLVPGATLVALGLCLLGLCHLPIRWGVRVALLTASGAGLAVLRANTHWFPEVSAIWAILGSMFMFRLMVYMYDLKNQTAPFSPSRGLAYFFMLPNVCFPLFPLVDYKTFCATYYNEDWQRIYQTGLQWMLRGAFQLLLYQAVYQYAPLDVGNLDTTLGAAGCVLGTYLLYLHVSGLFHLIVGLLHMFGFNLPETHHLFLLASSFTDFWRRINIYWKDFIMKLSFYPVFFRLRKLGTLRAMALSTLVTFFFTWLLHSWQWFWIRGSFLFTWQDISFWTILALLVMVNALYEATRGSKRKLATSRFTPRERLLLGLKTVGTFIVICLLWTLWSCQSADELQALAEAAANPTWAEIGIIVLVLAAIGVSGMIWGRSTRETSQGRSAQTANGPYPFWRTAGGVVIGAACLLIAGWSGFQRVVPGAEEVVARLRNDDLNARDLAQQRRGYYEELDAARGADWDRRRVEVPEGWNDGRKVLYRDRPDFLLREVVPSISIVHCGAPLTTNSLGMRDREYERAKPAKTYRFVLFGASHTIGSGIEDDETFESLTEERMNRDQQGLDPLRIEIMNMAVGSDSFFQKLLRLEEIGFGFQPDAVLFVVHEAEQGFLESHFKTTLDQNIVPPPGYRELVQNIIDRAKLDPKMSEVLVSRRLRPHLDGIYQWVFNRLAEKCRERAVRPFVVFRPSPGDGVTGRQSIRGQLIRHARSAGIEVIDLFSAFGQVDRNTLILAEWDRHTNPLGHRLVADTLYDALVNLEPPLFPNTLD